jgi:hypothetical protein
MFIEKLCVPAFIYATFTLTQILIDLYNNDIDLVVSKTIALIIFTLMLQLLCESGLTLISWIIVFVPFIFTSLLTFIVLSNVSKNIGTSLT